MNVLSAPSVANEVQGICLVLCTALMLARPARQLIAARGDLKPYFRRCYACVVSLSKVVKDVFPGGDMHKRVLRVAVSRTCFRIGSVVYLLWSLLEMFAPDEREYMVPRRLFDRIFGVSVVVVNVLPLLLKPCLLHVLGSFWALGSALTLSPLMQSNHAVPSNVSRYHPVRLPSVYYLRHVHSSEFDVDYGFIYKRCAHGTISGFFQQ